MAKYYSCDLSVTSLLEFLPVDDKMKNENQKISVEQAYFP
jgi:hypothetical protein